MKSFKEAGILPGVVNSEVLQNLFDDGGEILVNNGEYILRKPISLRNHIRLIGETKKGAVLKAAHSNDMFSSISGFLQIEGLSLFSDDNVGNAALVVDFPSNGMVFRDLEVRGFKFGFVMNQAICFRIDSCRFSRIFNTGIVVENTAIPDAGNAFIMNCNFGGPKTARCAVLQRNSGGLHFSNNAILGFDIGYLCRIKDSTSVLMIFDNSFEDQANHCVKFEVRKDIPNSGFTMVNISNNELTGSGRSLVYIKDTLGVKINDNICNVLAGATGFEFERTKATSCLNNLVYCQTGGKFKHYRKEDSEISIGNQVFGDFE